MIFLIQYNAKAGMLISMQRFADHDRDAASAARLNLEREQVDSGFSFEVATLEAPTEEHIRRTHSRYFESLESIVRAPSTSSPTNEETRQLIAETLL